MSHYAISQYDSARDRFRENIKKCSPLTTIDKIKAHILLSGAFLLMLEPLGPSKTGVTPSDQLRSFLSRAVHRLDLYLTHILGPMPDAQMLQQKVLPPLDVVMALYCYVLNPHRFYEDSLLRFPQLLAAGEFPVTELAALVDPSTFIYQPSPEQCAFWVECTGTAFDPFVCQTESQTITIKCPMCASAVIVLWENTGSGFGENNFSTDCIHCKFNVTHDRLCVAKFYSSLQTLSDSDQAFLPGTLLSPRGVVGARRPRLVGLEIIKIMQDDEGALTMPGNMSMADVKARLSGAKDSKLNHEGIEDLMRPFVQATPFSANIIQAILLQRGFWGYLQRKGWANHEYLLGKCTELETAYGQYVTFLEYIADRDAGRIIPTMEIDLIWHTHQLSPSKYREDTLALLGAFVDHVCWEDDISGFYKGKEVSYSHWRDIFEVQGLQITVGGSCGTSACGPSMTQDFSFLNSGEDGDTL